MDLTWWLSFAEDRFLGVAIVRAPTWLDAVRRTHRLGINPGGQVSWEQLGTEEAVRVPAGWLDRLLTREECAELERLMKPQPS